MRQIYKLFAMAVLVLTAVSACQKPETPPVSDDPQDDQQTVEQLLGTYKYDGKEYPVYSLAVSADESQIIVKISPFKEGENQTTYAVVGINTAIQGTVIDVEKAWHNDDYYFIYEDPLVYYSQYRQLQSGTIMIKAVGKSVEVKADLILPDGKKFAFEYK